MCAAQTVEWFTNTEVCTQRMLLNTFKGKSASNISTRVLYPAPIVIIRSRPTRILTLFGLFEVRSTHLRTFVFRIWTSRPHWWLTITDAAFGLCVRQMSVKSGACVMQHRVYKAGCQRRIWAGVYSRRCDMAVGCRGKHSSFPFFFCLWHSHTVVSPGWACDGLWSDLRRAHMAHRVDDHKGRLPVAQATVLALPPSSQTKVSSQE